MKLRKRLAKMLDKDSNPSTGSTVHQALKESKFFEFKEAIAEVHNGGGGKVTIMKRKNEGAAPARIVEKDVADAFSDPDFLGSTLTAYKRGIYVFKLWDSKDLPHSEWNFLLGEQKVAQSGDKKKKKDKDSNGKLGDKFQMLLLEKLVDSALGPKGNGDFSIKDALEMQAKSTDKLVEVLVGSGGGGESSQVLGAFMDGFQLRGEVQPQVEREDSTTAILQAIMPLVASFIGKKQGIPPNAVDPALLQQIGETVSARLQGVPGVSPVAGSSPGAAPVDHPPAPGSPQTSFPHTGLSGSGSDPAPVSTPPAVAGTQEYFSERFIVPFQADVTNGQSDEELAYQIVAMVQYARDRMADAPPPLVADFLTPTNLLEYDAALATFFSRLPELANLRQKCESIRAELIKMFMSGEETQSVGDIEAGIEEIEQEVQERTEEEVQEQIDQGEVEDIVTDSGTTEQADIVESTEE